jgi:hypothetical protein
MYTQTLALILAAAPTDRATAFEVDACAPVVGELLE